MTPPASIPAPEAMLAQRHFVRALVRSLLRGADGEDDVVQQAWLRGLNRAPRDGGRWRPWLARVSKNLALDHLREGRRRGARERRAATPEALPSTADVLQREEDRQRVVHAVLGLPQPYRTVVLLRFWEELTPAAIAARLEVPGATVRSQLKRGLAMLRERLDESYGDRRSWATALTPCAGPGPAMGAMLMSTKTKTVLAACVVVVSGLLTWWAMRPPFGSVPPPQGEPVAVPMTADARGDVEVAALKAREKTFAPTREVMADADALTVTGRVTHDGAPRSGQELTLRWFEGFEARGQASSEHQVTTDERGEFEWRGLVRETAGTMWVKDDSPRLKIFGTPAIVTPGQRSAVLDLSVVPLDCRLHGVVVDRAGDPIAGAALSSNGWRDTVSDDDGRFSLYVGRGANSMPLDVHAPGYEQKLVETNIPEDATSHELEIELGPGALFAGRVVDEAGAPVAQASVSSSGLFHRVETDADGRFVLHSAGPDERHEVYATKKGYRRGAQLSESGNEDIEIVLRRGLSLGVRVLDQRGRPVVGALVRIVVRPGDAWRRKGFTDLHGRLLLDDLEPGRPVVIVDREGFVRARQTADVTPDAGELVFRLEAGHSVRGHVVDAAGNPIAGASIYGEITGDDGEIQQVGVRTDSGPDGGFELASLPARPCTVRVHHRDYARASVENVGSGSPDLVVRMQRALAVAGRALDGSTGEPIDTFTVDVAAEPSTQSLYFRPVSFEHAGGVWQVSNWRMQAGVELCVKVTASGYAPALVTATPALDPHADQNVVLLYPGVTVRGTVRHAATGEPIPGANVRLVAASEADRSRWFRDAPAGAVADDNGRFSLPSVPAGSHRLRLRHAEMPETLFGPFEVDRGPGELEVRPTMTPGVTVRGRVVGLEDAAGWTVTAAYQVTYRATRAEVRPDLTFSIPGLAPGRYAIGLRTPASYERSYWIEIGDVDVDDFVINAREGTGSIRVQVRGVSRGYAEVEPVSETPKSERRAIHLFPFEEPSFVVEGLASGRYRVSIFVPNESGTTVGEVDVGVSESSLVIEVGRD